MSLESEVAALTTATTDLLEAVAIPQAALDAAAGLATTQVGLATTQAGIATTQAGIATTQASTAIAQAVIATTQANNAVAVVTGGTAALAPEAGKIPLADGDGLIAADWIPGYSPPVTAPAANKIPLAGANARVDCVIALMDQLPQGPDSARYPWMEGVKDASLREMKDSGKLDIAVLNPLWLATLTFGYAYMEAKPYGGMDSCSVRYLPGQNWWSLKHELSHCQGYEDHGIPLQFGTYTPEQQAIMDKEGVKKWTQTSVYQTGITR